MTWPGRRNLPHPSLLMHTYPFLNNYASRDNETVFVDLWVGLELPIDGLLAGCCQEIDAPYAFLFVSCITIQAGRLRNLCGRTLIDGMVLEIFSGAESRKVAQEFFGAKHRRKQIIEAASRTPVLPGLCYLEEEANLCSLALCFAKRSAVN